MHPAGALFYDKWIKDKIEPLWQELSRAFPDECAQMVSIYCDTLSRRLQAGRLPSSHPRPPPRPYGCSLSNDNTYRRTSTPPPTTQPPLLLLLQLLVVPAQYRLEGTGFTKVFIGHVASLHARWRRRHCDPADLFPHHDKPFNTPPVEVTVAENNPTPMHVDNNNRGLTALLGKQVEPPDSCTCCQPLG